MIHCHAAAGRWWPLRLRPAGKPWRYGARLAPVLAVALLLPGGAPPPATAQDTRPTTFTRDVLPGGLVVLVEERPGSGLVALEVAILAGARYETERTAGAAQFLEQLFLDGTPTRPTRRDVLRAITARGGDLTVEAGW